MRAMADAAGDVRPRRPEDATDASIPVAATVIIVRDGAGGPEVLLLERPDRGSFAGAWVFPGGKLDDADRWAAGESEEDIARRAGVRETLEETGLVLDPGALVTMSCWDPPPGMALRIRTWFFAAADPGGTLALSADEVVDSEWLRPRDALARHGRGELTLYPPTWVTLHGLADQPDAGTLLAALRLGGIRHFLTVARRGPTGPMLLWQEDAEYEADAGALASASRHRLEVGALPWIYTRAD
jgi:8-oxo-dGTP pyrophosphatase MutT (NUDIX family)